MTELTLLIILIFQGYQLCVLDYDFMILNNAFLIHRPGIKTAKSSSSHIDKAKVAAQNDFIKKIIMPELKQLYGTRKGCQKKSNFFMFEHFLRL